MFSRRLRTIYLFASRSVLINRTSINVYQNIAKISTTINADAKLNLKLKRFLKKKINSTSVPWQLTFIVSFIIYSAEPAEAKIIDGKKIAQDIREELREQVQLWMNKENQRAPQLTAVLVGEDPASHTYVKNKMKVHMILDLCMCACCI